MNKYYILIVFILFLATACKDESVVSSQDSDVPVDIHLQTGFENNWVKVYCNQQISFEAILSGMVPFSGPIAKFGTSLPRNSNTIRVWWQPTSSGNAYNLDSSSFIIGSSKKYYIGLDIINDSLKVKIQDIPFGYVL